MQNQRHNIGADTEKHLRRSRDYKTDRQKLQLAA